MQDKAPNDYLEAAITVMCTLNRRASELAVEFGASGGTDITGFGLLGHSREMANTAGLGLRFHFSAIPFIEGARQLAEQWLFPGGSSNNKAFYSPYVTFDPQIKEEEQMLLFDAQTSGGLLFGVDPQNAQALLQKARSLGQELWLVGETTPGPGIEVKYS